MKDLRALSMLMAVAASSVAHSTPLEIAVEDAAAPWSKKDGTGCANDIVKAAFAAAGVDINLMVVPYARCKDMVMAGKVAACFSMSWDPQFKGSVAFPAEPIYSVSAKFYRNDVTAPRVSSVGEIPKNAVVGIVNEYEYPISIAELKAKGIIIEPANSEAINLEKLSLGRIDYAIFMLDRLKTEDVLKGNSGINNVRYAFTGGVQGSYIGFSTRHPQAKAALEKYNEGYKIISDNGALGAIHANCRSHLN